MNKVKKLRKRKDGFHLFMSPEERFNAITTSVLWKNHGSSLRLFVLFVSLIKHVKVLFEFCFKKINKQNVRVVNERYITMTI